MPKKKHYLVAIRVEEENQVYVFEDKVDRAQFVNTMLESVPELEYSTGETGEEEP